MEMAIDYDWQASHHKLFHLSVFGIQIDLSQQFEVAPLMLLFGICTQHLEDVLFEKVNSVDRHLATSEIEAVI